MPNAVGVWIVGAYGDVAVSAMVGARAIAHGIASSTGLVTELPALKTLDLRPLGDFVFGGCDLRRGRRLEERVWDLHKENRVLDPQVLRAVAEDLQAIDERITPGVTLGQGRRLRHTAEGIAAGLDRFRARHALDRLVVVNLASTEPPLPDAPAHHGLQAFEAALDGDTPGVVTPSVLYAYAALRTGCAYVNFTPSRGPRIAALNELAYARGTPYCGNDGKTGETLVKTALAPMFAYRNLRVLSWIGFNLLGNNDGRALADPAARESKLATKGRVLPAILGYAPHTTVGIDYVASLTDWKTAWDFIHFEGFLGTRMSLQFTWQGCDSLLAAPLVLDLVRLSDLALRRGERGPMSQAACFFKDPIGVTEQNLAAQFQLLLDYATR